MSTSSKWPSSPGARSGPPPTSGPSEIVIGGRRRPLPPFAIFTRIDLHELGWTDEAITRAIRAGRLHRIRRGLLAAASPTPELVTLAAARACEKAVVSHRSALLDHALPLVGAPARAPEFTTVPTGTGSLEGALLHRATLPTDHVVERDGYSVTTVARTLIDVARSRPATTAVPAIDAALHRGLVNTQDLDRVVMSCWNWPGIGRAQRALRLADGRAESPLESISRLVIGWLKLPAPEPQALLLNERGVVIARLDFYWDGFGVAGEADGRSKYTDRDVLTDEKDRQDDVEDLGVAVARWRWWHTSHPHQLRAKIERAFRRGQARDRSGLRREWSIRPTEVGQNRPLAAQT